MPQPTLSLPMGPEKEGRVVRGDKDLPRPPEPWGTAPLLSEQTARRADPGCFIPSPDAPVLAIVGQPRWS